MDDQFGQELLPSTVNKRGRPMAKPAGKLGQTSTDFEVKQRKSARIVGIDHSEPGETAPHLVYFF
jgi:hypothetical protein